ncbi:HAD family hydrolase [Desulfurococcus amylolyticus]|uniref:HAD-superfamily hydrolase, subfamily IA, variant 1 n=1 Tax=Desulfurococcus amylolyticus DSM 16532 TaxID=768672 RepID=I3XRA8_DESAM|nr:HAD family hydrolase [Desulfurococcus amylolyticus]AFL66482.1 HAD-superfamily hydrolase, subfamily IA, variant 1 [Desulfurococcus amylolyticus DSM 16532]
MSCIETIVIDVDGTLIPSLVDFDKLRRRIREELGVSHELKPLGLSLSRLDIPMEKKKRAWEMIEEEELNSIRLLDPGSVSTNISEVIKMVENGFKVVIATHRSKRTLEPLLEKLGLTNYISEYVTRDYSIDRVEQLNYLKAKYSEIVFIGDTMYDEEASIKADTRFYRVKSYTELASILEYLRLECSRSREHYNTGFGSSVK